MATQALLLASRGDSASWLQSCLGEDVVILPADATTPEESVAEVAGTPDIFLIFVEFGAENTPTRSAIIHALVDAYPTMPVVAIGCEQNADVVLAAMRAGAEDFFVVGRDNERVGALLAKVLRRKRKSGQRSEHEHGTGRIITVFSSAQSPLLAFLGGHISFVLASRCQKNQRVLLFDLTLPGGNAIIMFDGAQDYTALDVLENVERCDEALVDSAVQRLDNGVYLLALPETFSGERFDEITSKLARLIDIFRHIFDHVVICADSGLNVSNISTLVARSDHALLLSDQSVLRSRQNKTLLQQLSELDTPRAAIKLVIVNYQSDIGMEPKHLSELLDVPLAAALSGRSATRMKAMNAGESMLEHAPSDGFTRGVETLTAQILGVEAPRRASRFALSTLFGRKR